MRRIPPSTRAVYYMLVVTLVLIAFSVGRVSVGHPATQGDLIQGRQLAYDRSLCDKDFTSLPVEPADRYSYLRVGADATLQEICVRAQRAVRPGAATPDVGDANGAPALNPP